MSVVRQKRRRQKFAEGGHGIIEEYDADGDDHRGYGGDYGGGNFDFGGGDMDFGGGGDFGGDF